MIDIKKHTVTEGKTTYDVRIYTDLSKLPHKFIQGVKLTKEEVLKEKYSIPSAFEAYCVWKQK